MIHFTSFTATGTATGAHPLPANDTANDTGARRNWPALLDRFFNLEALVLLAFAIRIAAWLALRQPLESDGLSYFTLAANMAAGHLPTDNLGQHAFDSIGYPALLAPFFALFGADMATGFAVNLLLAGVSMALVWTIARQCGFGRTGAQLAAAGYALWLPGIWNATMLARENLSTPLLLATAALALALLEQGHNPKTRARLALAAGAVWGAALLAGTSSLPIIAAPALALVLTCRQQLPALVRPLLALGLGAALVMAPWGWATRQMFGQPVLTTNTGFNLYIGNNPAATGRFISIADTPAGAGWHSLRQQAGEVDASNQLGRAALAYMQHNPGHTLALSMRKLVLFWMPNLPGRNDFVTNRTVALVRIGEVSQYLLLVTLGGYALITRALAGRRRAVLAAMIGGFWLLHGIAYIIPRYRDPIMPIFIILAAGLLVQIFHHLFNRETSNAA